ncbi:MAG: TlpA family protein disulfide reductase [Bacteroidaceae bacterium]|nr:TlpA family protein disulfide reductase [Bacteroidaceae bacterium]
MKKILLLILPIAATLSLTCCGGKGQGTAEDRFELQLDTLPEDSLDLQYATELLPAGSVAPDMTLPALSGNTLHLSDLRGRWVVLDFWASWCPDCRADIPTILRLYETYSTQGIAFVGVSFDDDAEAWKAAVEKYALPYPQVSELRRMRDSETAKAFGIRWIPSLYLIDPEGRVALGTVLSSRMERALKQLSITNKQ